ncbi:MAG: hypothetical protein CL927_16270 [Deltaproteobacteria bacterium]|nr:hypothetical protein [Deltaproteobacteria bacterium]
MKSLYLAFVGLLVGCGKKLEVENHYYSLVLEAAEGQPPAEPVAPKARVDLVAVDLPDFLRSRSLVLQVNTNEVLHARYHHWGEPLDIAVQKVLARDLSNALPKLEVAPGPGREADCTIALELDRFHASNSAQVLVSGRFVYTQHDQVTRREFDVSQVQEGDGYTSAVSGMRRALGALSRELASVVGACTPKPAE